MFLSKWKYWKKNTKWVEKRTMISNLLTLSIVTLVTKILERQSRGYFEKITCFDACLFLGGFSALKNSWYINVFFSFRKLLFLSCFVLFMTEPCFLIRRIISLLSLKLIFQWKIFFFSWNKYAIEKQISDIFYLKFL